MSEQISNISANMQETLLDLYQADDDALSNEQRDTLTPILNLLKNFDTRYKELEGIGEGAEKRITKVYDHRLGRCVAMARPVHTDTQEAQELFLREARLTASFSHANILPIHNMGIDPEGIPFFTMELLPDGSLHDILKGLKNGLPDYQRAYTLNALLDIFIKVCEGMSYAHSRSVLHLDLKPDNIRVGSFGDVIICDWGLAQVLNDKEFITEAQLDGIVVDDLNDATLTGTLKGTPGFMAPEQAMAGKSKTYQTDIYALGAILYAILTLRPPVTGNSANEILEKTRQGNIAPPSRNTGTRPIPKSLSAVALKALSTDPENRYSHVQQMVDDITRYRNGYITRAEKPLIFTRLVLFGKRNSLLSFLILVFLLVLSAISIPGILVINQQRRKSEAHLAALLKEQATSTRLRKANTEIIDYLIHVPDLLNASATLAVLEEQMLNDTLSPEIHSDLLVTKGQLYFILEEFNAAVETLEQVPDSPASINFLPVCRIYASLKPDDGKLLGSAELAELFSDRRANRIESSFFFYCYANHMRRNPNPSAEEYLPLASTMLGLLNNQRRPDYKIISLTKKDDGYYLDLSDSNFSRLRLTHNMKKNMNVLSPFHLKHLDFSDSKIDDYSELQGIYAEELSLVGVKFKNSWHLNDTMKQNQFKRVYIDTDRDVFPAYVVRRLKKFCEVVIVPDDK